MIDQRFKRRHVLCGAATWSLLAAIGQVAPVALAGKAFAGAVDDAGEPFAPDTVRKLAEALAQSDFVKPTLDVPEPFKALKFEQYRDIRFKSEQAIWRGDKLDSELQLLPLGWIYDVPVDISIVDNGKSRRLVANSRLFSFGAQFENLPEAAPFGFSGFRLHGPLNRADRYDEFAVFQGASYFRAVGRGQGYGLSARGLAVNTAQPTGEEFPFFRSFWIERPRPAAADIVVHGVLDSPSITGAYRFVVRPGLSTVIDVDATLFPRRSLTHVGIAPLTSMYFHGTAQNRFDHDYRPAVHNSEGLAILNGSGERLWRPLANPKKLQTSAFIDKDPKGFGLVQRDRAFASFEDLEARFERRPSVWIEPRGGWGDGYVELIEIPAEEEIHDNIVAYWKPAKPLEPGAPQRFMYRLYWGDDVPVAWAPAQVVKTYQTKARGDEAARFVIDFAGPATKDLAELPTADLSSSAGSIANVVVRRYPDISGIRVSFELKTGGTEVAELRLGLKLKDQLISESWLYRWTLA